jgi:hypothetical protein
MNKRDIAEAKNPDLRLSVAAMQRAARMAREIAIQTDTYLVVMKDGKIVQIPAAALREAAEKDDQQATGTTKPRSRPTG